MCRGGELGLMARWRAWLCAKLELGLVSDQQSSREFKRAEGEMIGCLDDFAILEIFPLDFMDLLRNP